MKPAPKKRRDKEATKAALLRAGAEAFGAQGFEGATLDGIAEAAGVNKAMIAYYFKDKGGLFQAILEEALEFILARVTRDVDTLEDPAEQFAAYIRAMGEMMAERPFFPAMLLRDYQSGRFQQDPELVARLMRFSEITKRILTDGVERGVFRAVDYHLTHLTIVGSLAFFVASSRFRKDVQNLPGRGSEAMPQLEGFIENLVAIVLGGISA